MLMRKRKRVAKVVKKKGINIVEVQAAGGVLARALPASGEVLIIRRNGFWDLPKGKVENGESFEECAIREVEEETGLNNPVIESFLCKTYHEFTRGDILYGKNTYWYSMNLTESGVPVPQLNEGITDVIWIEAEKARELVYFPNLKEVMDIYLYHRDKKRRDELSRLL
jgi:8-oxo-dGTP pyrophosphatase MutT (NUDIX family)